jgi:hypothetical protein
LFLLDIYFYLAYDNYLNTLIFQTCQYRALNEHIIYDYKICDNLHIPLRTSIENGWRIDGWMMDDWWMEVEHTKDGWRMNGG